MRSRVSSNQASAGGWGRLVRCWHSSTASTVRPSLNSVEASMNRAPVCNGPSAIVRRQIERLAVEVAEGRVAPRQEQIALHRQLARVDQERPHAFQVVAGAGAVAAAETQRRAEIVQPRRGGVEAGQPRRQPFPFVRRPQLNRQVRQVP